MKPRRWTGWLAPLGVPASGGRVLASHGRWELHETAWLYRVGGDPVRVGTVATLDRRTGWLVATGIVWDPGMVELMEKRRVVPELSLIDAHPQYRDGRLVFLSGTVAAIVAGTYPAWPDVRFILEES